MEHAFVMASPLVVASGLWMHGARAAIIAFAIGRRVERLLRQPETGP